MELGVVCVRAGLLVCEPAVGRAGAKGVMARACVCVCARERTAVCLEWDVRVPSGSQLRDIHFPNNTIRVVVRQGVSAEGTVMAAKHITVRPTSGQDCLVELHPPLARRCL